MNSKINRWMLGTMATVLATGIAFGIVSNVSAQDQGTGNTAAPSATMRRGGHGGHLGASPATIAKALGITEDELLTAQQAGKSVAELASEKGVTLTSVVDSIIAERTTQLQQAVTDGRLTQAQADGLLANEKANLPAVLSLKPVPESLGVGGRGPGGFGGFGEMRGFGLKGSASGAVVAEALGITETDLRTALQAGKSIADVATEKNVQLDVVINAIVAEETTRLQQAVTDGKLTQAQADERLATLKEKLPDMLNQTGGMGPGFGDRGGRMHGRGRGPNGQNAPQDPNQAPSGQQNSTPATQSSTGNL